MEIYREDRKVVILALQVSLILHLILYILLKIIPTPHFLESFYQPIEIELQKEASVPKKVEISQTKSEVSPYRGLTKEKQVSINTITKNEVSHKSGSSQHINRSKDESMVIDESNFALLSKITSSETKASSLNSSTSFGEELLKVDRNASGDAISRKVLYRPPPIKLESEAPQPSIRIKIFISPDGTVSKVVLLNVTSDQNLNRRVVEYMMKWRFNPIVEDVTQYAVLTVYF
ncbi:MAG: energy transducer TonB [Hydrogenothermaceae bacterium]|nr:energy transducer TonB [Hydrogenothermaceae bacterium]